MTFIKQKGACAFTAACTVPGPRVRLAGTNLNYCGLHAHILEVPIASDASATEFSATAFHAPRTKKRKTNAWMAGAGVGVL